MEETFSPVKKIRGAIHVPGDKPVSHRALILAAMASGTSRITHLASGRDVATTLGCLTWLWGVDETKNDDDGALVIHGRGWGVRPSAGLDARNSGTTMRLLTGALAGRSGEFLISGDASLSRRPMDRVAEPLRRMGASITLADDRFPPIAVKGGKLEAITYEMPVASAQVKGAVLLAGIQAEGSTLVVERHPSRDHTERMLEWLGVPTHIEGLRVGVEGRALPLDPFELSVPGDFSSAAYPLVAAILVGDSDLEIEGVGLNPSRTGLIDALRGMGASIDVEIESSEPEPVGTIRVRSADGLTAISVDGDLTVRTIDELSLVALAATRAQGTTVIRDAAELRVKESDRVAVLAKGLRSLGAEIEETSDGLAVSGPTVLSGGLVSADGDHRMALTFAVAGCIAREPVTVSGWEWSRISYPGFEDQLRAIAE